MLPIKNIMIQYTNILRNLLLQLATVLMKPHSIGSSLPVIDFEYNALISTKSAHFIKPLDTNIKITHN